MNRVLVFGALGPYTAAFTRALSPHIAISACIVKRPVAGMLARWARRRPFPEEPHGFAAPVFSIGEVGEPGTYVNLARFAADLVVVAGFPRKLPLEVARLARIGVLNLHPALLPRDRGPCPLFWSLRRGDVAGGVSLHVLTEEFDAGDLVAQASVPFAFGATGGELSQQLGTVGGRLVAEQLPRLLSGEWHLQRQGADVGAWARKPQREDFEIRASEWSCRTLFAFVRGARAFGLPWANLADDIYAFTDALSFAVGEKLPGEFAIIGRSLTLALADGTVTLQIA